MRKAKTLIKLSLYLPKIKRHSVEESEGKNKFWVYITNYFPHRLGACFEYNFYWYFAWNSESAKAFGDNHGFFAVVFFYYHSFIYLLIFK